MLLILLVISYVTTFLHFFIYCLPHHLFYLDMCDVTTYVTPTVGSLTSSVSNITHIKTRWVYSLINEVLHVTTHMLLPTIEVHYKKDTSVTFWAEQIFSYHTYDTSMTIIVKKTGIIIDVVGSYFYDKKSWQKMGFSSWAGRRRSCMTFFGPSEGVLD